jgi:hypothetical protein
MAVIPTGGSYGMSLLWFGVADLVPRLSNPAYNTNTVLPINL